MPEYKKGEDMNSWLARCIPRVSKEHPELDHKAVVGRCAGMFRSNQKKARRK